MTTTELDNRVLKLQRYISTAFGAIEGWLDICAIDALAVISDFQESHAIEGDALEIGVHHGRFFIALNACLRSKEVGIAIDIFDSQDLNVDGSGSGSLLAFKRNLDLYTDDLSSTVIVAKDSLVMRPPDLLGRSVSGGFRLISVDGGHTAEHVMNDLAIASNVICNGGVVFIDDWMSPHWPGVHEGYLRYMMHANRNLAPVLFAGNKLLMTTISYHEQLLAAIRSDFKPRLPQTIREVQSYGFLFLSVC
jgi:hypothetical protein